RCTPCSRHRKKRGAPYPASAAAERPRSSPWSTTSGVPTASPAIPTSGGMACLPPHDEGVLAVVGVVAAADTAALEAELLVEPDRVHVRDAHLEGVAAAVVVRGQLEE